MKEATTNTKSNTSSKRAFWEVIDRVYSKVIEPQRVFLIVVGLCFFLVLSVWWHPSFKQRFFETNRQQRFERFLQQVKQRNDLDLRSFWEFREFFAPGSFRINENVVSVAETLNFKDEVINNPDQSNYNFFTFMWYESPYFNSSESLSSLDSLKPSQFVELPTGATVLWRDSQTIIYRQDSETIVITWQRSTDEMQRVNGMFDYSSEEKKFLSGKVWHHRSEIQLKSL